MRRGARRRRFPLRPLRGLAYSGRGSPGSRVRRAPGGHAVGGCTSRANARVLRSLFCLWADQPAWGTLLQPVRRGTQDGGACERTDLRGCRNARRACATAAAKHGAPVFRSRAPCAAAGRDWGRCCDRALWPHATQQPTFRGACAIGSGPAVGRSEQSGDSSRGGGSRPV